MLETGMKLMTGMVLSLPEPMLDWLLGPPVVRDGAPLDRRTQMLLRLTALVASKPWSEMTPAEAREDYEGMSRLLADGDDHGVVTEDRSVPGPAGPIPVRLYRPAGCASAAPAIVYFHGGGWVIGSLETHDSTCRALAAATDAIVVAVDYRLAPEHPFPASVDDALAAYAWLVGEGPALGVDPSRVAVAGDSAGGNLAAVVARLARDAPDVAAPRFQLLLYPATDLANEAPSVTTFADGFLLTRAMLRWFYDHTVPRAEDRLDPRASPLHAPDLAGLAPARVVTAGFDPLRDEGAAYAARLRQAGVEVETVDEASLIHGFIQMRGTIPAARRAFDDAANAVRSALYPRP